MQRLHIDCKTYFAKNVEEVLGWHSDKLNSIIDLLKDSKGNSVLTNNDTILFGKDLTHFIVEVDGISHWISTLLTDIENQLISNHYKELTFAGYPLKFHDIPLDTINNELKE